MEIILSTCGTSILTNNTACELRQALTVHANAGKAEDVPEDARRMIEAHINKRKSEFAALAVGDARGSSAELNGILAYYGGRLSKGANDTHYLLATDTWLGRETAETIQNWLKTNGVSDVRSHSHSDLQTGNLELFHSSLADLVKWCKDEVASQRSPHRRVVFNLSGGFKSETGFLQLLGMFYADEIIYIFERSGELMRIPRLPVEMADEAEIRKDLRDFRRASLRLSVTAEKDGVYWFESDGEYSLTPWGEFVFSNHRDKLYKEKLLPSPSRQVVFGKKFCESCTERFDEINRKIDYLARYMEDPRQPKLNSLDFKKLKGSGNPSIPEANYECDAWHDGVAKRIFCNLQGDSVTLLKLEDALH